jgi:hypothetical protein
MIFEISGLSSVEPNPETHVKLTASPFASFVMLSLWDMSWTFNCYRSVVESCNTTNSYRVPCEYK